MMKTITYVLFCIACLFVIAYEFERQAYLDLVDWEKYR